MTATRASGRPCGHGVFRVPSRTRPGRVYEVIWHGPGLVDCRCAGFSFRGTCWHVRAVERVVGAEMEAALPARERAALALRRISEELMCEETA